MRKITFTLLLTALLFLMIAAPALAQEEGGGGNAVLKLASSIVKVIGTAAAAIFAIGVGWSGGIAGQLEAHFGRPGALADLVLRIAAGIAAFLIGLFATAITSWIIEAVAESIGYNIPTPW